MNKVSVILPNYNHSRYLNLRIETILNQTYPNFELIILDDCSTDNSREIIEKYRRHPRVSSIIYNQQNSGSPFIQWEKGILNAKGEYIWIAESDDYSDKDFITHSMAAVNNNPGVGLVFCASNITDDNNVVSRRNYDYNEFYTELLKTDFRMNGKEFCEKYLFFACVIVNASAVLFKKDLFKNISKNYKNFKVSGDWRVWIDICYETDIYYLNESLNYFRFHTNNVRTSKELIMNREAIMNFMDSYDKTDSEDVKKILKETLFKHWCFEFSRDLKKFRFNSSFKFFKAIFKIDKQFFLRLYAHSVNKLFNASKGTT